MLEQIKALTLWQPWATLVAHGAKRIETRSWFTSYRGPLAIHAAASKKGLQACYTEPFRSTLKAFAYPKPWDLPRQRIIAICELADVLPAEQVRGIVERRELAFGDFSDFRYAWLLRSVHRLAVEIPVPGRQGFWTWDYSDQPENIKRIIRGET